MITVEWNVFVSEDELPLAEKILIKFKNDEVTLEKFFKNRDTFFIEEYDGELTLIDEKFFSNIKAWSTLEEKPKSLVNYFFEIPESELKELQELLYLASDRLDSLLHANDKKLRINIKKFQDKFSKVEF